MTVDRQRARAFGLALEWRAAIWLRLKGYRILARNYSVQGGELDIVALSPERWVGRGVLCFVEVRGRAVADIARESVGWHKQERVRRAAQAFVRRQPRLAAYPQRFDVISAGYVGSLVHTRHAFDA